MKRRGIVSTGLLIAALLAAAAFALLIIRARPAEGPAAEFVPASWTTYRTSLGHTLHVGQPNVGCADCHDYEHEGFKNPGTAPCARCHAAETAHGHKGDPDKRTDCLTCHVFSPKTEAPTCISCHASPMGPRAAIRTHATTDCSECHKTHDEPATMPKDCTTCHEERATGHTQQPGSHGCADCHEPHAPASAAVAQCSRCHVEAHATSPAGHGPCTTCHKPHDFTIASGASACAGCHGDKPTLVATRVPAHQDCTNCHDPHSPGSAADSCQRCHSTTRVSHGAVEGDGSGKCIDCHKPHGPEADREASPCTSCHGAVAPTDVGAHAGGIACTQCHTPHDFSRPARMLTSVAGGGAGGSSPPLCATCHGRETTLASTNPGHRDCATCHGGSAHAPVRAPACGTCHAAEKASAPKGHTDCNGCHEPHRGEAFSKTGAAADTRPVAASCASCHANKTKGPHDGVKGGCETCHRPHGPSGVPAPPACVTCHALAALPALHDTPGHATCAGCHTSHGPARSDRQTCTGSCHTDRRDHQPDAPVCSGCHRFRP